MELRTRLQRQLWLTVQIYCGTSYAVNERCEGRRRVLEDGMTRHSDRCVSLTADTAADGDGGSWSISIVCAAKSAAEAPTAFMYT